MAETLLIGGILGIVAAAIVVFIAFYIQRRRVARMQAQQQAWERSQEIQQRQWKVLQEKRAIELEKKLSTEAQCLRDEWQAWEQLANQNSEQLAEQYASTLRKIQFDLEIAQLPRIEEVGLTEQQKQQRPSARLQGADLAGYDLSHRYLGYADLRGANLAHANLFMSDLSGAHLANANLSGANLSGANLSYADLRGAVLTNANFLVADLNSVSLMGANLTQAHSLREEQLTTALYDSTTQFDEHMSVTLTRIPRIRKLQASITEAPFTQSDISRHDALALR